MTYQQPKLKKFWLLVVGVMPC